MSIPKIIFANTICATLIWMLVYILFESFDVQTYYYNNLKDEIVLKIDWNKLPIILFVSLIISFTVYATIYYIFGLYKFFNV